MTDAPIDRTESFLLQLSPLPDFSMAQLALCRWVKQGSQTTDQENYE